MAQVFRHKDDCYRSYQAYGVAIEGRRCEVRQPNPGGICHAIEFNRGAIAKGVCKQQVNQVADYATEQYGEAAQSSRSVDCDSSNGQHRDNCQHSIELADAGIIDRYRRQIWTEYHHYSTRMHRTVVASRRMAAVSDRAKVHER